MKSGSLFEDLDDTLDDPLPGPLPPPEAPVVHLLALLRQRGMIVVESDWLTDQWAMTDQEVLRVLTHSRAKG